MDDDEQKDFNQASMFETNIPSNFNSTTVPNGDITPGRRPSVMNIINRRSTAGLSQCPFSGQ